MIQNEHQKTIALEKIKDLKLALLLPKKDGVVDVLYKAGKAQIQELIRELEAEVADFEKRQGQK